jgi:hypothetical protein
VGASKSRPYAFGVGVKPAPNFDLSATFDVSSRPDGRAATMSCGLGAALLQCSAVYAFPPLMIGSPRKPTAGQTSTAFARYRTAFRWLGRNPSASLSVPDHCRREF